MDTASEAIVTIDESNKVLFATQPLRQIFGYEPEEIVGKQVTMLVPEHLRPAHLAEFRRYLYTSRRSASWKLLEVPGLHKDGSEISLELSFGEYQGETGRVFAAVTSKSWSGMKGVFGSSPVECGYGSEGSVPAAVVIAAGHAKTRCIP